MTAIHKKRLVIIAILTACAMFVIGLFCAYKPIKAKAAETIGFSFEKISPASA